MFHVVIVAGDVEVDFFFLEHWNQLAAKFADSTLIQMNSGRVDGMMAVDDSPLDSRLISRRRQRLFDPGELLLRPALGVDVEKASRTRGVSVVARGHAPAPAVAGVVDLRGRGGLLQGAGYRRMPIVVVAEAHVERDSERRI